MSKKYSRLVRIDFNTFNMALDLKQKNGYRSLSEVFEDSLDILKNKDIKKRKLFKEIQF